MNIELLAKNQSRFLGAQAHTSDHRDLAFKNYCDAQRILEDHTVAAIDWTAWKTYNGIIVPDDTDPLGNQKAGCCVLAAPGHHLKRVGLLTGRYYDVTEATTLREYQLGTGYDPLTGANDNGANIRDILKRWKNVGLFGTRIDAFATVDWTNPAEVVAASYVGCGLIGGYDLPLHSQYSTDEEGRPLWNVPPGGFPAGKGKGTWGGHCIWTFSRSPGLEVGNSWGERTASTQPWQSECCFEKYIVIHKDWLLRDGNRAPNGFAYQDMLSDVLARAA